MVAVPGRLLFAAAGLLLSALLVVACTSTPSTPSISPVSLPSSTTSVTSSTITNTGFPFTTSTRPPLPIEDSWWELRGEGYASYKFDTVQEGETLVKIIWVSVDADKESRATYQAVYDHFNFLARGYGPGTSSDWRVRVVLVEATDEQKVLETRDFGLSGGGG